MLRELHPLCGQPVEVGCFNFGLTVTSQLPIAQVIGQNVNDVGRRLLCLAIQAGEGEGEGCRPQSDGLQKIPTIDCTFHENYVSLAGPNVKFAYWVLI
jgi:hypothetical protein